MRTISFAKSLASTQLCAGLFLFLALTISSDAWASHGPLPVPPEGRVIATSMNIYAPDGQLIESTNLLEVGSDIGGFLGPGIDYTYDSSLGTSTFSQLQIVFGSSEFDFEDGDLTDGVEVPIFIGVGPNQRAYQYLWDLGGQTQVVIGLFDLVNMGGVWSVTSADTDPNDHAPGTAFLAGPLAGYSVTWDMVLSAPIPAGMWLFLSALLPFSLRLFKRPN